MDKGADRRVVVLGASLAAVIVGQMIAAKATRDTLFLSNFDIRLLPRMVVVSAILSAAVTLSTTRLRVTIDPRRMTAALAVASAAILGAFYFFEPRAPKVVAALLYLHTMSIGPLLATGFWSAINEALDPRSAKKAVAKISAGGTIGAVIGGLIVERVGTSASVQTVLLFLAGANVVCLIVVPMFPRPSGARAVAKGPKKQGAIEAVLGDRFLRTIAGLVIFTVIGAALLDYALKAEAVDAFGGGGELLRFFAWYYVATAAVSFAVQVGAGRWLLEKLGVVRAVSTLPMIACLAGGLGIVLGGIVAATVARGLEQIVRSSLYRSAYELLYTPVAPAQKRAGKPLIEVVVDRSAEAVGGGLISLFVWFMPERVIVICFGGAIVCGVAAVLLVRRLQSGYVDALAGQLDSLPEIPAAAALLHEGTLTIDGRGGLTAFMDVNVEAAALPVATNPYIATLLTGLLSSDIEIVRRTLGEARPIDERLVAAVILLLDDKDVKTEAAEALREVAARHIGQLADVIAQPDASYYRLRARVAHLLGEVDDSRAVDALEIGLSDPRFDVRLACGRALLKCRKRGVVFERPERFYEAVKNEFGRQAETTEKTTADLASGSDAFSELVRDRSDRTTEHVFRLLALVLPQEPIERAFKAFQTDDKLATGTALEYLENVIPADLWSMLAPALDQ